MSPLRAELEMLLDHLDETQTRQMLAIARILYDPQPDDGYSEEDDPFIKGIFHDSPDLAIRSEEILQDALPNLDFPLIIGLRKTRQLDLLMDRQI